MHAAAGQLRATLAREPEAMDNLFSGSFEFGSTLNASPVEWPRTIPWMQRLARELVSSVLGKDEARPVSLNIPALLLRNLLFLVIVLLHGLRRLLPPYWRHEAAPGT